MQNNLKNNTGVHLAKSHINAIVKDATKLAERHGTVHNRELALNTKSTAVYTLFVVDGNLLDITVSQIRKA